MKLSSLKGVAPAMQGVLGAKNDGLLDPFKNKELLQTPSSGMKNAFSAHGLIGGCLEEEDADLADQEDIRKRLPFTAQIGGGESTPSKAKDTSETPGADERGGGGGAGAACLAPVEESPLGGTGMGGADGEAKGRRPEPALEDDKNDGHTEPAPREESTGSHAAQSKGVAEDGGSTGVSGGEGDGSGRPGGEGDGSGRPAKSEEEGGKADTKAAQPRAALGRAANFEEQKRLARERGRARALAAKQVLWCLLLWV